VKPLWFGPVSRPLFGWLHIPEGDRAKGCVLLSPTLGIEAVGARYAYRMLGDRLAGAGLLTLRFDYDGTGDSAGMPDDPDRVRAWVESTRVGLDLLRSFKLGRTGAVGMRVGAPLLVEALGSSPPEIDDLVLWDPCPSGRAFLREQSALWAFTLGATRADDGSVETPGLIFDPETVAQLSELTLASGDGQLADRVLLLMRAGRKGDRRLNERLTMPNVERRQIAGQEDLIDVEPGYAVVPVDTIDMIVDWLGERAASGPAKLIDAGVVGRNRVIIGSTAEGGTIEEEALSLGPLGLFGIMTRCRGAGEEVTVSGAGPVQGNDRHLGTEAPTILFLNAGVLDHVGPARLWVHLARTWAELGFRVVRLDLNGMGDSPVRPGPAVDYIYAPDALDDVHAALRDVLPDDPSNAILVGLCSGAYHAIEGAIAHRVRGVCAVNPALTFSPPEVRVNAPLDLQVGKLDTRRQATGAKRNWTRLLPGRSVLGPMVERMPDPAWWLLNRVVVESPPVRTLTKATEAGAKVLVIAGTDEARELSRGEGRSMNRLERAGRFHMEVIAGLEHTLLEQRGRAQVVGLLTDFLRGEFVAPIAQAQSAP
jgi:alpha-beta hydrolase superfamily lysophospholipase